MCENSFLWAVYPSVKDMIGDEILLVNKIDKALTDFQESDCFSRERRL